VGQWSLPVRETTSIISVIQKSKVTSATKPVPTSAVVPYQKWSRRNVAVMESVEEENDENIDPGNNFDPEDSEDALGETDSTARDKKLNAITARGKLGMTCFRCVTTNSCTIPNCEYSHDRDIVAAARDKQMADLTEAKRQMQAGHQATLKVFDKQGAKAVKPNAPQMRPTHTDTTPRLSLLIHLRVISLINTRVKKTLVLRELPL